MTAIEVYQLQQKIRRLEEENKRLREALQHFLGRTCDCLGYPPLCDSCYSRGVLRETEKKHG